MAARARLILLCLILSLSMSSHGEIICNNPPGVAYTRREGTDYCYRFFATALDFSNANRSCIRNNAALVRIDTADEDSYINGTYYKNSDFWIGLSDQGQEGIFKWLDGDKILEPTDYSNWAGDGTGAAYNDLNKDCVKYSNNGWQVHNGFCQSSHLPYLCRQKACNSSNGLSCDEPPSEIESTSTLSGAIIAVIIIVPLVIIVIVAIIVVLVLLWKFKNDFFHQYICFCTFGNSKKTMNSLKQENQRLRHEISQQKISTSGHFQRGQLAHQLSSGSIEKQQPMFHDEHKVPFRSMSIVSNKVTPSLSGSFNNNPGMLSRNTSITSTNAPIFLRGTSQGNIASKQPWIMGNKPSTLPVIREAQTPIKEKNLQNQSDSSLSDSEKSSESGNSLIPDIRRKEDTENTEAADEAKTKDTITDKDKSKQ